MGEALLPDVEPTSGCRDDEFSDPAPGVFLEDQRNVSVPTGAPQPALNATEERFPASIVAAGVFVGLPGQVSPAPPIGALQEALLVGPSGGAPRHSATPKWAASR